MKSTCNFQRAGEGLNMLIWHGKKVLYLLSSPLIKGDATDELKTHHPAKITKFCFLNFQVVSPNAIKYTN